VSDENLIGELPNTRQPRLLSRSCNERDITSYSPQFPLQVEICIFSPAMAVRLV